MAIGTLTYTQAVNFGWTAQTSQTGADYQPVTDSTNVNKKLAMGTASANGASLGGDELYSKITSIAGGASASIDLTSIQDILLTSGVALARVKAMVFRLLDATDDSTVVTGTPATSVTIDGTVTNGLVGQSHSGWFDNATSQLCLTPGDFVAWGTKRAAGVVVDGTHKVIKVINNDVTNTAAVQITVFGASS